MVQIGLGTFATVVQNLAGEPSEWDPVIAWLLESLGEVEPDRIRAVGVEPVREHVQRLRDLATNLPMVRLVEAALSDEEHVLRGCRTPRIRIGLPKSVG